MTLTRTPSQTRSKEPTDAEKPSTPLITDFQLLNISRPPNLPPKARPLSELNFFNKTQEEQKKRKSFHIVNDTVKQKYFHNPHQAHLYHFKNNIPNSAMSELEAFCCDCYRLIIPEKIPSAHAYYDDVKDNKFVGVASKNIHGFESNRNNPLLENDTIIASIETNTSYQRQLLTENIKLLIKCLDRSASDPNSSYFSSFTQFAKNQYNYYFNNAPTAVWLSNFIDKFLKPGIDYSVPTLETLIKTLEDRKKFLAEKSKASNKKYDYELHLLTTTNDCANNLLALVKKNNREELPIEEIERLEEMDKIVKHRDLDLKSMDEKYILKEKILGNEFSISIGDLINYRTVKGLAMGLSARWVYEEADNHNRNMAKNGTLIDFDMSIWPILNKFKDIHLIDRWLFNRLPSTDSFKITATDIRNFPNIQDAQGFYYWPTKTTYFTKSMVDTMSALYDAAENLFTRHDNEIFQKLSVHPVFIFHKFKTFLKYTLTTKKMYQSLAELNIRKELAIKDEKSGTSSNLIEEIVRHEDERIAQLRKTLITMPEFQNFLYHNGEYVFNSIFKEFEEYKEKYELKLNKKTFYQNLVDSIDLEEVKKEYEEMYKDAMIEKRIREAQQKPPESNMEMSAPRPMVFN